MERPKPRNWELWKHMVDNHDLHLLDSELYEIELIVAKILANDRATKTEHSNGSESGAVSGWMPTELRRWVKRKRWLAERDAIFHNKRGASLAKRHADGRASLCEELLKRFPKRPRKASNAAHELPRPESERESNN